MLIFPSIYKTRHFNVYRGSDASWTLKRRRMYTWLSLRNPRSGFFERKKHVDFLNFYNQRNLYGNNLRWSASQQWLKALSH